MPHVGSEVVHLPAPDTAGAGMGIERVLALRRSVREFSGQALSLAQLGQLVWATQGVSGPGGVRTAPSAGALYPLELLVVAGHVADLPAGVYRYAPYRHVLVGTATGDRRDALAAAVLHQEWLRYAPVVLAVTGVVERSAHKYGARAERYMWFEAGCAAQNAALQAVALGLGGTVVGAFDDRQVAALLGLGAAEQPLLLLPLGYPR